MKKKGTLTSRLTRVRDPVKTASYKRVFFYLGTTLSRGMLTLLAAVVRQPARGCQAAGVIQRRVALRGSSSVGRDAEPPELAALVACGRRGRWSAALNLLEDLEREHGRLTPVSAWHAALQACEAQGGGPHVRGWLAGRG